MEGEDRIPVLKPVESLNRMPIVEMENVKAVGRIIEVKLVHHRGAHAVAVFNYVFSEGLAIVITDTFDCLIGNIPPREEMHFMVLVYQCFCEMCRSPGKTTHPFSIHRFPAEERYFT